VCSPQTLGKFLGDWVPFGRGRDQAGDQQEDDARSLTFETPPLDTSIEILGAPVVTLDVASDRPIAKLVVRLCDVHPSGESHFYTNLLSAGNETIDSKRQSHLEQRQT
jgi:uncharacterized protein